MKDNEKPPERPEEVELTTGLPITLKEHIEIYGDPDTALGVMKQRCEAGHDWVCAAYIDQIEAYITRLVPEFSVAGRSPVMTMLYDIELEAADMLTEAKERIEREYGVEEYEAPTGKTVFRFKDMPEEKGYAIVKKEGKELVQKFEDLMLNRLGQERYDKIQEIRGRVRKAVPPKAPKKVTELKKAEEIEKIEEEIVRLAKIKEEIKEKIKEKID